ncbi:thioesterase family protein [Novosphingobium sp. Gsoil 351]|uniref:thioesterase family protein n=1 Tax=Novosphingobium sp. Gsoil 351 TaxID=2675225 RepID=UPI0012B4F5F1|nr:thioesterase family protein [Novosphingobium sp. Gsoil 351]QGN53720.1 thioesterase family protein [Novosphingobium sp. Gsoil 351]
MSLPAILAAARPAADGFTATIPADWMQGRTSYGGLSAALALEAARRLADDLPPLRSATVNFVGPLAGEVTVRARILRRGRNATWASAEVASEAGVGLTATFVFMGSVESSLHLHDVPPPAGWIAPDQAKPLPGNMGPSFIDNFDRRFALPRQSEPLPEICWWIRLKDRAALDPMVALMLCADGLPPAVIPLIGTRVAISSMTWILNLLTPAPVSRDDWWMIRAAGNYAENGCSSQDMTIWNSDGQAITAGMQSIAVFG